MDIIIGREEGIRRLHCIANGKEFNIGTAGCVPQSVSRKHCVISLDSTGKLSIRNLNDNNITYVDGTQVLSKSINADSLVQIGNEKFPIPIAQIISLATGKPVSKSADTNIPTYSLLPLKAIWDEYDRKRMEIQEEAAKSANKQRLQGILSMLGMCIGFIPGIDQKLRIIIIVAALAIAVYFFVKGQTNDSVQKQLHDLDEELTNKYKCPNPKCGKPFGAIKYKQIEFNQKCFACGCKYTH